MIFPCPALNGNGTFNDQSMDFSEIPMIHRWDSMGLQPGHFLIKTWETLLPLYSSNWHYRANEYIAT